jgi:hypothetical protein
MNRPFEMSCGNEEGYRRFLVEPTPNFRLTKFRWFERQEHSKPPQQRGQEFGCYACMLYAFGAGAGKQYHNSSPRSGTFFGQSIFSGNSLIC